MSWLSAPATGTLVLIDDKRIADIALRSLIKNLRSHFPAFAMINSNNPQSDLLLQVASETKQKAEALRAQADEAARMARFFEDLRDYSSRGWDFHVVNRVERDAALISRTRTAYPEGVGLAEGLAKDAKERTRALRVKFPNLMLEAANSAKLPLDPESRHPRYTFERGFIVAEIDEYKGLARLSDHEGRLAELPADVGAVMEAVHREHGRLFGRAFNGEKFLGKLRLQYGAILKKEHQPEGSSVSIRQITARLGKNEDKFRSDEFLIDLSLLMERGPFVINGRRLELQQTKDTNQGMLLHGAAGRGYVGFITFQEDK